jgi:DUF971 family protein
LSATSMPPVPTKVKLAGEKNTLAIHWSDGHVSAFPYRFLRDRCPCASCTGSELKQRADPSMLPMFGTKALKPDRAELVGRYALQIFWNDGHSSGIYSFEYLRGLCPCAECKAKELTP